MSDEKMHLFRMVYVYSVSPVELEEIKIWKVGTSVVWNVPLKFFEAARNADKVGVHIQALMVETHMPVTTASAVLRAIHGKNGAPGVFIQDDPEYVEYAVFIDAGYRHGNGSMVVPILPPALESPFIPFTVR